MDHPGMSWDIKSHSHALKQTEMHLHTLLGWAVCIGRHSHQFLCYLNRRILSYTIATKQKQSTGFQFLWEQPFCGNVKYKNNGIYWSTKINFRSRRVNLKTEKHNAEKLRIWCQHKEQSTWQWSYGSCKISFSGGHDQESINGRQWEYV